MDEMQKPPHVSEGRALALIARPALLSSESADEFEALVAALRQEIEPRGIVEHMYVSETASIVSEILRFRRCKAAIINAAYCAALKNLLSRELNVDYQTAEELAQGWFTDDASKKQVAEILRQRQLDDSAIEAEAIRSLASELEMLDRMLTSLEGRRNRTIRFIAEYRQSFAKKVRDGSDRLIEGDSAFWLDDPSAQSTA